MDAPLSSLWGGLSPHLIATFYAVDSKGKRVDKTPAVKAPIIDSPTLDIALNWISPFENTTVETAFRSLTALAQSGAIQDVINSVGTTNPVLKGAGDAVGNLAEGFQGRTGITKLNSTQVFSGMPPMKFTATLLFRAWRNPVEEVENPVDQLIAWALPQELAPDSTIVTRGVNAATNGGNVVDVLMPSKAPHLLAMSYKGRTYAPLVIESLSDPIGSPVTAQGRYAEKQVAVTLCTLTAWDKNDWRNTRI